MGHYAFGYIKLSSVHIEDLAAYCEIEMGNSQLFLNTSELYIEDQLISELNIPDGVNRIRDYLFFDCNVITSVHMPDGVTEIGLNTFRNCLNISTIDIPQSMLTIQA